MVALCLALIPVAMLVSAPACWAMLVLGRRLGAHDTMPVAGQTKMTSRAIPNTGGVGIFLGLAIPMLAALAIALLLDPSTAQRLSPALAEHLPGMRSQLPLAAAVLACMAGLHVLGLYDDRRPLGPIFKLAVMVAPPVVLAVWFDTRLLELLDHSVGGSWLSILVTVAWFVAVTNAMNFMDNMDGLSAGVGAIAGGCFLVAALINGQWFVAAMLALLVGASLGFLIFNFPPARLFMGDGGSLVIGFVLAFLTVRTTYTAGEATGPQSGAWYAVLMPLVVLAVPLYDMVSVTVIRIRQGKSPLVGDLQHFSHRLVMRGLSKRAAVLVIYGCTLITGLGGVALRSMQPWQALLVGVQTLAIVGVLAVFEHRSASASDPTRLD